MDVLIKIKDREGVVHELKRLIYGMNIMELCKAYELPVEGTLWRNGNVCFLSMLRAK
jgi:2Fe-2S ferredoxin